MMKASKTIESDKAESKTEVSQSENLARAWTIFLTDPNIGLYDENDPSGKPSIFRINGDESEVTEQQHMDWGEASQWALVDATHNDYPWVTKRASIQVNGEDHYAYFGLFQETPPRIRVLVQPTVGAGGQPTGFGRGRP